MVPATRWPALLPACFSSSLFGIGIAVFLFLALFLNFTRRKSEQQDRGMCHCLECEALMSQKCGSISGWRWRKLQADSSTSGNKAPLECDEDRASPGTNHHLPRFLEGDVMLLWAPAAPVLCPPASHVPSGVYTCIRAVPGPEWYPLSFLLYHMPPRLFQGTPKGLHRLVYFHLMGYLF